MNTTQRIHVRILIAFFKCRAFWRKQIHRLHARFGRIYCVTTTYQWPGGKPRPRVVYARDFATPELGTRTNRGYVVAWDVTVLK